MTSLHSALELIPCAGDAEDLLHVTCPDCRSSIMIHQPDERQPDRLLGVCVSCFAWFLMAPGAVVMVRLPDEEALGGFRIASPPEASAVLADRRGA